MGRRHDTTDDQAPICLECGARAKLVAAWKAFPGNERIANSMVAYLCDCGAKVACHPYSTRPLGRPANPTTAYRRIQGHEWLRKSIAAGCWGRKNPESVARRYLAEALNIPSGRLHFGEMNSDECRKAIEILEAKVAEQMGQAA